jgi:DNA-binding transcriptional ArsR family regulator
VADRRWCSLLAAFEEALGRIAAVVVPAYEGEREWPAKVRAAVAALLAILDDELTMSMFVFVGALGAGPKVLACRMEALERLKVAFENGIDGMGRVAGSEIAESSPLSAEGAVNAVLGILHTRMLEGSPLARRPLSELAGPLTAMIVLPYLGPARPGSKVRPKVGTRKHKRARLSAKQRKLVAALQHGARTVRELVDVTGMSDQTARYHLKVLEGCEKVVRTERDGKLAYELPAKGGAAAGSSGSNGAGSANGVGRAASNGAGASTNGHGRSAGANGKLQGLDIHLSEREFKVIAVIDELNARGSSSSNRVIRDAAQMHDPTQLSKLIQRLAHLMKMLTQN